MAFNKPLPEWNNPGVKPNQGLIDAGWKPDDKPPADVHNWWMNSSYEALKQLQEEAVNKDQVGIANGVAPLGADGKVPASMVSGNTEEIETTLENHIQKDLGHVRFAGGASGQNAMVISIPNALVRNPDVTNPIPETGYAFRFVKNAGANNTNVTLQIDYGNGKTSLAYPVLYPDGKQLSNGAMIAGGIYTVAFSGTAFFLQGSGSGVNIGTRGIQLFNTVGTTQFTVPDGVTRIVAQLWGGGGGGGGANSYHSKGGGGGGSGGFKEYLLRVTPGSKLTVNVGYGGSGGTFTSQSNAFGMPGTSGGPSEVIGAASGNVVAWGGGAGTGAISASGYGGEGGSHTGQGMTGSVVPPVSIPKNGKVYQLSELGENLSPLLRSILGSSGSYGSSYQGGGGGGAPSDTYFSTGGQNASPGSATTVYSYQTGGSGGNGAGLTPTDLNGLYPGGGGAGGNSYTSAVYNGGNGASGLVILAW